MWNRKFTLRDVLIVIAVVAICIWPIVEFRRGRVRQANAERTIRELGGEVYPTRHGFHVGLRGTAIDDSDIGSICESINSMHEVFTIDLSDTELTDVGARYLMNHCRHRRSVVAVGVEGTRVSPEAKAELMSWVSSVRIAEQ